MVIELYRYALQVTKGGDYVISRQSHIFVQLWFAEVKNHPLESSVTLKVDYVVDNSAWIKVIK